MKKNPPTIVQVIPRMDAGGAERTVLEMNEAIIKKGWRSLVVCTGGRHVEDVKLAGGKVIDLPVASKNPVQIIANKMQLIKLFREEKVDLVHARSRAPAWSCYWACQKLKLPFVTTYHGAYKAKSAFKRWYNSSMIRGDHVIANSNFTRERILATYDAAITTKNGQTPLGERLVVVPRGADMTYFNPAQITNQRIQEVRKSWFEGKNGNGPKEYLKSDLSAPSRPLKATINLVMPARMSEWKGHDIVIKALEYCNNSKRENSGEAPELRIVFFGGETPVLGKTDIYDTIGDGAAIGAAQTTHQIAQNIDLSRLERFLRQMVIEKGVGDLVHFAGYCDDMAAAYAGADGVIVASTRPEAFGRVCVEAGAMGLPVIASDHGGARETVIDGQTGYLVPPGDASALASKMVQFVQMNDRDRQEMGIKARTHIMENFSTEKMCAHTLAIYEKQLMG